MDSPNRDVLRDEVRRVLALRRWSVRQAARATGIDHTTVIKLAEGSTVKAETLMRWARGIGEPVSEWLKIAGREDVLALLDGSVPLNDPAGRFEDFLAADERQLLDHYQGLDAHRRKIARDLLDALADRLAGSSEQDDDVA
jgi:transcriptional regulator with XRE-family HTH domain